MKNKEYSVAFDYIDQEVYKNMLGFYKAFGIKPPPPPDRFGVRKNAKLPKSR
jgi:hypothetical protein